MLLPSLLVFPSKERQACHSKCMVGPPAICNGSNLNVPPKACLFCLSREVDSALPATWERRQRARTVIASWRWRDALSEVPFQMFLPSSLAAPSHGDGWVPDATCDGCRATSRRSPLGDGETHVRRSVRPSARTDQVAEPSSARALRLYPSLSNRQPSTSNSILRSQAVGAPCVLALA